MYYTFLFNGYIMHASANYKINNYICYLLH